MDRVDQIWCPKHALQFQSISLHYIALWDSGNKIGQAHAQSTLGTRSFPVRLYMASIWQIWIYSGGLGCQFLKYYGSTHKPSWYMRALDMCTCICIQSSVHNLVETLRILKQVLHFHNINQLLQRPSPKLVPNDQITPAEVLLSDRWRS